MIFPAAAANIPTSSSKSLASVASLMVTPILSESIYLRLTILLSESFLILLIIASSVFIRRVSKKYLLTWL